MGIRINKQMGYFIPEDKFSTIIVDNHTEIIEGLDYGDNDEENKAFDQLAAMAESISGDERILDKIQLNIIGQSYKRGDLKIQDLVREVYCYDDFLGLIFCTPSMARNRRHDDDMDFYESSSMLAKINYINRPIYPVAGFVYHGGLEKYNITHGEPLEVGKTYYEYLSTLGLKINKAIYEEKYDHNSNDIYFLLTNNDYFYPAIDSSVYAVAKASGILQPHVTFEIFQFAVKAAIIETWG